MDFGLAEGEWAATGERFPFYALTISFPGSNNGVTQAFPSQNQECLLEGMKRIFEHIGGVPPRLRFDNMTTAVAQVLKDGERVLTDGFTRFMLHYRFQADFCNPASGNEKGNVENKVGYSRRNAFVPVPVITSFEEFNEQLLEWCEKDADRLHYKHKVPIRELFRREKTSGGSGRTCIVVSKNRTQELERELAAAVKEGTGVLWVLPVLPKGRQEEEETPRGVTVLRWEVG